MTGPERRTRRHARRAVLTGMGFVGIGLVAILGVRLCMNGSGSGPRDDVGAVAATGASAEGGAVYWPQLFDDAPFDLGSAEYEVHEPGIAVIDLNNFGKPGFDRPRETARIADVIERLREGDEAERERATLTLGEICFGFSYWSVRWCWPDTEELEAMRAAVNEGRTAPRVRVLVSVLIDAFDDPSPSVRETVAYSFLHIGPAAATAVPRLRKALNDEDSRVVGWSARALYVVDGDALHSLEANIRLLNDTDPKIRVMGAYSIHLMGKDGLGARAELERHLDDPVEDVRVVVRNALEAIVR